MIEEMEEISSLQGALTISGERVGEKSQKFQKRAPECSSF